MPPSRSRVFRGRKSQEIVADFMRSVWPRGESRAASLPGTDIKNTPGWRVECKATRDGTLTGAMTQCEKHPGEGTPIVIWRPDGYGPEKIGKWLVVMRLEDFRELADGRAMGFDRDGGAEAPPIAVDHP